MAVLQPEEWRHVAMTHAGGVTTLTLHSDGAPLVWNARIHRELVDLWTWLAFDDATRVVILTGAGDRFCTEIDSPSATKTWHEIWWEGRRIVSGLVDLDVPVIAVVNGPATVHAELPALADIVLAVPEANFADRAHFVRGVVPGDGIQVVWQQILGPSRASYFLLTGAEISCDEALRIGMVHEVHPREVIMSRANELAAPMAGLPREVLAYTRASLRLTQRRTFSDAVSHGLALAGIGKHASCPPQ
jgi:enoyl-CoA hydratase/carnithine racemase